MKLFDNVNEIALNDMIQTIKSGSSVSVVAACFSMYAYKSLQASLDSVEQFRFIFNSPTFISETVPKAKREFYIPRLQREQSLYGTEFEIRLRNEMTLKAVALQCADWIRSKARFKSIITGENAQGSMTVSGLPENIAYFPLSEFTTIGLGAERGNNISNSIVRLEGKDTKDFINKFNELWNDSSRLQDVTEKIIDSISSAYLENSPEFIYFLMLYNVFSEFLDDISDDTLPNEGVGFKQSKIWNMLYDFQKDAVLAIINKLEKYNGCILADSVGLGKTFTALAVIKYYEDRNKSVLVLCPKKLSENWNTFKDNYINNPIVSDRLRYDVLYHTDLIRTKGFSNGLDLSRLNWGAYDLVVIDESHNFRNGAGTHANTQENRYLNLMTKVINSGVKTKVLMLSATPVNNRFTDLKNQLALAYEGNPDNLNSKLNTQKSIEDIFRQAQRAFNDWSLLDSDKRTTDALLKSLDFDFFEALDSVTIARSRKHIMKYYNMSAIGQFPKRLKPISLSPNLTDLNTHYDEIYNCLSSLNLSVYTPSKYIFPSKQEKYKDKTHNKGKNLTQAGREFGILKLMSINLLKRLESSIHSFRLTVSRVAEYVNSALTSIQDFERSGTGRINLKDISDSDFDLEDSNDDLFTVGKKIPIDLADIDCKSWKRDLKADAAVLKNLLKMVDCITPKHDLKLQELFKVLDQKITRPINPGNKKILIFSAFADTADYLYDQISQYVKKNYNLDSALITGSVDGRTTIKGFNASFNNILTCFSPVSKCKETLMPNDPAEIDVLIATDCISEGQNLQDCDYLINYDIHWNPVRIIQRFGRIDRIGSKNDCIQLVNFWPNMTLDDYINLKNRVESRMKASIMTSTGDDNLISPEEKGDLEYRKAQLKRLQEEVIDIEDMSTGISIMDLGLNEFRLDLLEYVKNHEDIYSKPKGLHAVVSAEEDCPPGVIFVLRNVNQGVNIDNLNRIHPFYMVYIAQNGEIVCDYLNPKALLDTVRLLCKGKNEPILDLCKKFNKQTKDGRDMRSVSTLLNETIKSIVATKDKKDIDSLFTPGGTTALNSTIHGLDDFELICFFVVK